MVTQKVIKEIYKKYGKAPSNKASLEIQRHLDMLKEHHDLYVEDGEIINRKADPFNPFGRMLIARLNGILEFDKYVAFVFPNHILFFEKNSDNMHVHFKPEKKGFFSRIFSRKE